LGNLVQAVHNAIGSVRAGIAISLLAIAACASGCRQIETATGVDPIAASRPLDSSAAVANHTSARTTTVYRISEEDREEAVVAADDRYSSIDCSILPRGRLELVSYPDVSDVSPFPGDSTKLVFDDSPELFPASQATTSDVADEIASPLSSNVEEVDRTFRGRIHSILASTFDDVWHDYGNYYSRSTAIQFAAIVAPAAVFANTDLDANFATWYQTHIRSSETNRVSDFFRPLGDGYYTIPVYVSAKFVGEYFDDVPGMKLVGQFGDRASRALLVGAPPLLAVQYLTGGGRPSEYTDQSYWRPFHSSHGASGHAFMGAVPFLTLAGMTDDPLAKCFFYACSPWTGMTRINDNVHYLSQVWLGWWMAYLACESVNKTENQKGPMVLTPLVTPEMTGVGVIYEH
jgi:hypothetical protein